MPAVSHANRQHIVAAYDRELTQLRALVIEMSEAVVEQTRTALRGLLDGDEAAAQSVVDREPQLDGLSQLADEEVFAVIARRQPTAADLRLVLAIAKVVGELERGGDKAERIARNALRMIDAGRASVPDAVAAGLHDLDAVACCMLERAVDGLTAPDLGKAAGVFQDESRLRAAASSLNRTLVEAHGTTLHGQQLAGLLTIAHALERIGNHAANIAEQVVYVITGEDVRYRNRELLLDALRHGELG
jgi:phosphate transport system protein